MRRCFGVIALVLCGVYVVLAADTDAATKTKPEPKEKPEEKPKPEAKPKPEEKPKPAEDSDEAKEKTAATKLDLIKQLIDGGKKDKAKERLEDLVKAYPMTKAATEAKD